MPSQPTPLRAALSPLGLHRGDESMRAGYIVHLPRSLRFIPRPHPSAPLLLLRPPHPSCDSLPSSPRSRSSRRPLPTRSTSDDRPLLVPYHALPTLIALLLDSAARASAPIIKTVGVPAGPAPAERESKMTLST